MRVFRYSILCACLLLSGSSVIGVPRATEPERTLVTTVEGCRVWLDSVPDGATVSWTGACRFSARLADGRGRMDVLGRDGFLIERYDGGMSEGLKHGRGGESKYRDRYGGWFAFGAREGRGEEIIGGVRYAGWFRDGKRSGAGTMTWLSRDVYRGSWKGGLPEGRGEAIIGTELFAGRWHRGCLLFSDRVVAVATPLDSCRGLAPDTVDDFITDAPEEPARSFEGGCQPKYSGSSLRLCSGLVER
jgi:hypothetical protein